MVKLNIMTASSIISRSGKFKQIVNDLRSKAGNNLSNAQEIKLIILSVLYYLKAYAPKSEADYINKIEYLINNFNNITEIQKISTSHTMVGGNLFNKFYDNIPMNSDVIKFVVMATIGIIGFAILQISLL
jgi:poly(3-hydroxyalkanoate) synthetase